MSLASFHVRARTFCCCIPVRFGVLVIGTIGLLFGSVIAVAGVMQSNRAPAGNKLPYMILTGVYALLALFSLLGIIGAIMKQLGLIKAYFATLTILVILSVASGAFSLYRFFEDAPILVIECINKSTDSAVFKKCHEGVSVIKGVLVAVFVFVCLIEIWGCVILSDYSEQLGEEQQAKDHEASKPQW
ncbi:hypothetical protein DFH06DRAFT_1216517 [Mycena polygramma]|nr:hypothetical protein DFH06DRAFT_1216517 [Mycena polygramma]